MPACNIWPCSIFVMTALMRKASGTDGSLLASLPWTLAALGFSVAPHVPYLPFWITGALIICAALRLQIERNRRRLGEKCKEFRHTLTSQDFSSCNYPDPASLRL